MYDLVSVRLNTSYCPHIDRFATVRTGDGGKAECKAVEIVARVDFALAPLLDAAQQFAHRSMKAVGKPFAVERGSKCSIFRFDRDRLF